MPIHSLVVEAAAPAARPARAAAGGKAEHIHFDTYPAKLTHDLAMGFVADELLAVTWDCIE
jgi:hypothetical protein